MRVQTRFLDSISASWHSPHTHDPLKHRDSIRLLQLVPGLEDSPIVCKLLDAKKTEAPSFEALSYTWRPPKHSCKIQIADSGGFLRITRNLHDALLALRHSQEMRTLWIDAICIDQANIEERGHQVAHMRDIYRRATRVLVWLGREKAEVEMQSLHCLVRECQHWGIVEMQSRLHYYEKLLSSRESYRLFARPWFERVWTVQEFVLATDVEFMAGTDSINGESVRLALEVLGYFLSVQATGFTTSKVRRIVRQFGTEIKRAGDLFAFQVTYRETLLRNEPLPSLRSCIMNLSRDRACSDGRDRVYAMLGLANDNLGIEPNYAATESEVLFDFASRCLTHGDLAVLHGSGTAGPAHKEQGASFVPLLNPSTTRTAPFAGPERKTPFRAGSLYPVRASMVLGCASVTGVHVDTIKQHAGLEDHAKGGSLLTRQDKLDDPRTIIGGFYTWNEVYEAYVYCSQWYGKNLKIASC